MTEDRDMKVTILQEISLDNFDSVIVGALEGTSKKWAHVKQSEFVKDLPRTAKFFLGDNERIAYALYTNPELKLPVYEAENPDRQIGYVNQTSMRRAFELAAALYPQTWNRFIEAEHTDSDIDIFFQLASLGEVSFTD